MYLDEGSMSVLSATMLRSTIAGLAKANMVPTKTALEAAGIPEADELAEEKTRELELGAMARLKRPR